MAKNKNLTPLTDEDYTLIGARIVFLKDGEERYQSKEEIYQRLYYLKPFIEDASVQEVDIHFYTGPLRYGNPRALEEDGVLLSIDLQMAYANFLNNNKLPGASRTRYPGLILPRGEEIAIITFTFAEEKMSKEFETYFLNENAFSQKKITRYGMGNGAKGYINILARESDTGLIKLFNRLAPSAKVKSTIICTGGEAVSVQREELSKYINMRYLVGEEEGKSIKKALAASTGWLARADRPAYYYMVQGIKSRMLTQILNDVPLSKTVAINTDGAITNLSREETVALIHKLEQYPDVKIQEEIEIYMRGGEVYVDRKKEKEINREA